MSARRSLPRRAKGTAMAMAWGLACALLSAPSRALDPFEIQVYDGTANKPGEAGLELHTNYVANGLKTSDAPELPQNHQLHLTLEPSLGLLPWWELGMYFQTAVRADGTFDYAGTKLRSKFVTPPDWNAHWKLGANFEVSYLPDTYERDRWGAEIRPIVAWTGGGFAFAVNPIIGVSLAGDGWSGGPTFEPAVKALREVGPIGVGLEYYGSIGAIASPDPLSQQRHYVFEVIDFLTLKDLEVNLGVGEGLTPASNGVVVKVILGHTWDTPWVRRESAPAGK